MQRYRGRLREVVSHENRPTWRLFFEETQTPDTSPFWERIHYIQLLSYDMRSFMLPLKVHRILLEEKYIPVADPDLQIRGSRSFRPSDKGGPGHPDPEIRGAPGLKIFFSALRASVWSKNKGERAPPGPSPGYASEYNKRTDQTMPQVVAKRRIRKKPLLKMWTLRKRRRAHHYWGCSKAIHFN